MHGSWSHGGWFHGDGCGKHGSSTAHKSWRLTDRPAAIARVAQPTAFNPSTTDPVSRYAGAGAAGHSAAYYSGLPDDRSDRARPRGRLHRSERT